jgi:hypothetical protein
MNERDKDLAIEAGFDGRREWPPMYKEFADLIRADAMEAATRAANESWSLACKKMVEFEREACAQMVEELNVIGHSYGLEDRIRARGSK